MFGDLGRMLKAAADVKRRMPEVQARLESSRHVGEASGGAVRATVNGKLRVLEVRIDAGLLADGDVDAHALGELVRRALCAAQDEAAEAAVEAMGELTGGVALPGLDGMLG
jgi:DNA-binding protein YbaB